jgi:hypothetical protein
VQALIFFKTNSYCVGLGARRHPCIDPMQQQILCPDAREIGASLLRDKSTIRLTGARAVRLDLFALQREPVSAWSAQGIAVRDHTKNTESNRDKDHITR